jgi:hypothetical protein
MFDKASFLRTDVTTPTRLVVKTQNRNDSLSIPFHSIRESEVSANQECLFIECADFRSLEVYCKGPQVSRHNTIPPSF